jgi:hypothetical protein
MTTALEPRPTVSADLQEKVLLGGDLSKLLPQERLSYYQAVCQSVGLNPLTRPFEYLVLNDKMVLYARKDCTDQLRDLHGISIQIVAREMVEGVYVVTAQGKNMTERTDESIGAVPVVKELGEWKTAQSGKRYFQGDGTYKPLGPDEKANAMMKAETKAKRRVTLSICGLGMLDETELETIPGAKVVVGDEAKSVPLGKTFAEKFPEQAHKISEKLAAADGGVGVGHAEPPQGQGGAGPPVDGAGTTLDKAVGAAQQASDAPEEPQSDPTATYRRTLAACAPSNQAINQWWGTVPDELKQDLYCPYSAALKALGKKK